jgi:HSP20 family protein
VERSYGAFQRLLSLPEDADRDKIDAAFKGGVMKITIPRRTAPEKESAKQIEIKQG